jgi:hypothetical protein
MVVLSDWMRCVDRVMFEGRVGSCRKVYDVDKFSGDHI